MIFYLDPQQFIDTSTAIDLSLALRATAENPRAWYVDAPRMEPVRANGFIGSVAEGGAVNFRDIFFNPHGHGTHTQAARGGGDPAGDLAPVGNQDLGEHGTS